jgi:hypothetical protein
MFYRIDEFVSILRYFPRHVTIPDNINIIVYTNNRNKIGNIDQIDTSFSRPSTSSYERFELRVTTRDGSVPSMPLSRIQDRDFFTLIFNVL